MSKTGKAGFWGVAAFCCVVGSGVGGALGNVASADEETTQVEATKTVSLREELQVGVYDDSDVFALSDIIADEECSLQAARSRWLDLLRRNEIYYFKDVELFKNYVVSLMLEEEAIAIVAEREDVDVAKFDKTAKPFLCVWGRSATQRNFDKFANLYFSDELDYSFTEADLRFPVVIACDPSGGCWSAWIEAPAQGTADTDLNFYNLSEELFRGKYDGEKKARHIAYLKRQAKDEVAREFSIARKAERSARAAARNADRVSRQNAVIQSSRATQQALGKPH